MHGISRENMQSKFFPLSMETLTENNSIDHGKLSKKNVPVIKDFVLYKTWQVAGNFIIITWQAQGVGNYLYKNGNMANAE